MISRLAELNRLLVAVRDLMDERRRAPNDAVIRQCASRVIEGRLPDHSETMTFAQQIGLLERQRRAVRLTDEGAAFLYLNAEDAYDLTPDQQRLLIRSVYLSGVFRRDVLALLGSFAPAFDRRTYRWSPVDGSALPKNGETIIDQLRELGAVVLSGEVFEVAETYVDAAAALLAEGKGWTEEALQEFLRERQEIGDLAEQLALRYERERLHARGCEVEAECVRHVSKLKVNAGYDIESFHAASRGLHYDRFIEVKGSRDPDVRFIWSENELKVARALGNRYWIYFQGGIDSRRGRAKNKILTFQDPATTILNDARFTVTQHGVIVEARVRGEAVAVA